jgi:VPS28 protein
LRKYVSQLAASRGLATRREPTGYVLSLTFAKRYAALFAMLKVMQSLEVAYSRDLVDSEEYTRVCQRLISQKRTLLEGEFKAKARV